MNAMKLRHWFVVLALCAAGQAAAVTCTLASTTLPFGVYSITAVKTGTATVTVTCTKQAGDTTFTYEVRLNAGGGSFTTRTMASGGNTLDYNIYRDVANTLIWGNGTAPSTAATGAFDFTALAVGASLVQTFTGFGTIPAHSVTNNNDKPPGAYARNITATLRRITPAPAANLTTATMAVSATINPGCGVVANGTLAFGAYDPTSGTALDATTTINFRCTMTSIFDVGLGGTVGARTMAGPGGDTLSYELYSNAARTTTWGNTQDTNTVASDDAADTTGNGISTLNTAQTRTIYGRIPAGQDKNAGSYSSTVTITIYY
jgi:spore coat protein U-like protein